MKELTEKEALFKAEAYCSIAEHCCSEVEGKLASWNVEENVRKRLIERLIAEKYIDEERYCYSFINDKLKFNKWGPIKISQALKQKRIPSLLIEKCLKEIDKKEYAEILTKLIFTKKKNIKAINEYELKGKLVKFALGKGFEINEIMNCIDSLENETLD